MARYVLCRPHINISESGRLPSFWNHALCCVSTPCRLSCSYVLVRLCVVLRCEHSRPHVCVWLCMLSARFFYIIVFIQEVVCCVQIAYGRAPLDNIQWCGEPNIAGKIRGFHGGDYEECRHLSYGNSTYLTGDTLHLRYSAQPVNAM
jgi:hypothetical protein